MGTISGKNFYVFIIFKEKHHEQKIDILHK